jgi:hypothetical protein
MSHCGYNIETYSIAKPILNIERVCLGNLCISFNEQATELFKDINKIICSIIHIKSINFITPNDPDQDSDFRFYKLLDYRKI